jgi:hypothetical protein
MTLTLTSTVIERYYKDYINNEIVTEGELSELEMLFGIIYNEIGNSVPPTKLQLLELINQLRLDKKLSPVHVYPIRFRESVSETRTYLDMLHSRELVGDQRTAEWKMQRHKFITASVSAACAGIMGPASRENQLLEKASMGQYSPFNGGYYTDIGNIYEPVTNSYYSYINNTRIHDFALIPSNRPGWEFLAASTDGVAERGTELTNIEIKTLPGRVPDGKVKKMYYHQMQHQMECLGLNHSDFIEVKYQQLTKLLDTDTDTDTRPMGIIAELYSASGGHCYEYSPAGSDLQELMRWQNLREPIMEGYTDRVFVCWIYWVQTHYSCIRVERDPTWIKTVGPALRQFYNDMIELRKDQRRVQQMIRDREVRSHNKRNTGNSLFNDCMI